jgi:HD-GYP domain-containing protein (c-di-GMP phosphodiesterase class II)
MISDQDLYRTHLDFVQKLSLLLRTIKVFNPENETLDRQVDKCLSVIWAISKIEKRLSLKVLMNAIFVNDARVRVSRGTYQTLRLIIDEFRESGIGEVTFMEGVSPQDLRSFLYLLLEKKWRSKGGDHPLAIQLIKRNIYTIIVKPSDPEAIDEQRGKEKAKKIYFRSIAIVREVCESLLEDKPLPLRKTKRLVQSMVDLLVHDRVALQGLSTVKNYDEYTYNHSVNVSIYALAVGKKLGFSKKILAELGMAALLHDVGKVRIPDTILRKRAKLNEVEWEIVKSHPMIGVEQILEFREFAGIHPRVLFGIFDHHLNFNASGYPSLKRKKKQTLFGKIITMADVYDALTSPRCYRKGLYSPVDALKLMWKECGVHFDPTLFKVFVNAIGIYPIGSLVQLDSDELGIVYETNSSPRLLDRPTVLALATKEQARGRPIDLSETDETTGGFKRSIVRCVDPKKYDVCVQEYFL